MAQRVCGLAEVKSRCQGLLSGCGDLDDQLPHSLLRRLQLQREAIAVGGAGGGGGVRVLRATGRRVLSLETLSGVPDIAPPLVHGLHAALVVRARRRRGRRGGVGGGVGGGGGSSRT
eukprot:scaffold750_cov165-Ochromonas_danica.AAC.2